MLNQFHQMLRKLILKKSKNDQVPDNRADASKKSGE